MIDHLTVTVADMAASRAFYERVLAPLGYSVRMEYMNFIGIGNERKPYLWLKQAAPVTTPQHIAFKAPSREAVDAFHAAALAAGARDDGAPGVRAHYHEHYYGAFVVDPVNGHPIEAVCHAPPAKKKAKAKAAKKSVKAKKKRR